MGPQGNTCWVYILCSSLPPLLYLQHLGTLLLGWTCTAASAHALPCLPLLLVSCFSGSPHGWVTAWYLPDNVSFWRRPCPVLGTNPSLTSTSLRTSQAGRKCGSCWCCFSAWATSTKVPLGWNVLWKNGSILRGVAVDIPLCPYYESSEFPWRSFQFRHWKPGTLMRDGECPPVPSIELYKKSRWEQFHCIIYLP